MEFPVNKEAAVRKKTYLFMEPTLGLPIQPLLARELCIENKADNIIWLEYCKGDAAKHLERISGYRVSTLNEYKDEKEAYHNKSEEITRSLMGSLDDECGGLHSVVWEDVPIGLYLVSYLQRHNTDLCRSWIYPKTSLYRLMKYWLYTAYILSDLAKISINSFGLFTHHVYLYGFLSETLYRYGVPSLTYGSPGIPLMKPRIGADEPYEWSMASKSLQEIRVPISSYENSQRLEQDSNEYIHYVTKSYNSSVSNTLLNNTPGGFVCKELTSFLERTRIDTWIDNSRHDYFKKKDNPIGFCLYLHSFTDSTFTYNHDGFDTLYEYYLETAECLSKVFPDSHFFVRPHPNIYNRFFTDRVQRDLELTISLLEDLHVLIENMTLIHPTVSNKTFLESSINAIAVTHHSPSMTLETTLANRFVIKSSSSIKLELTSPLILKIGSRESLGEDCMRFKKEIRDGRRISSQNIAYMLANAVPKLYYNPTYNNKIVRSMSIPALVAGYDDFNKEYAPLIAAAFSEAEINSYGDYLTFLVSVIGRLSYKALSKEISLIMSQMFRMRVFLI